MWSLSALPFFIFIVVEIKLDLLRWTAYLCWELKFTTMNKDHLLSLACQHHAGIVSAVWNTPNCISFLDANDVVQFSVTIGIEKPIFQRLNSTQSIGSGFMATLEMEYHKKFPLIAHMATRGNIKLFSSYEAFKVWVADYITFCNLSVFNDGVTAMLDRDKAVEFGGLQNPDCIIKRHVTDY